MYKLFTALAIMVLAGCSTVDSVIDGTKGIVGGVASDVVAVPSHVDACRAHPG